MRKVRICCAKVWQETNGKVGSNIHQDRITDKCLCYATAGKVLITPFQLLLTIQGICVLHLEMPT